MALSLLALCQMSLPLQAASLIWDTVSGDGATTTDGAGTWTNGSGNNWNDAGVNTTWSNATPDSATFGSNNGAAGTVTLGSNITVGNIVFNAPGSGTYSIVPAGFSLTLSSSTITVNSTSATITAPLAGSTGLTKDGSGTLILNNTTSSTYTGATTINAGTLQITGGSSQLPSTTAVVLANTAGATLDVGSTFTIIGSLAGGGAAGGNVVTTSQFKVGDNNTSTTYAGSITGNGGMAKGGSGTLTLTGNNTYTSTTFIQSGTIKLDTGGSLSGTGSISLSGGSTLLIAGAVDNQINTAASVGFDNGTLKIDGSVSLSQTLGYAQLFTTSTIDFGATAGGNTLHFADSNTTTVGTNWGGTALNIYNWTAGSDHLFFGTNSSGLTSAQLAKINFYSDAGTTLISSGGAISASGEVSAVPEPSSVLGALSLLALAGFRERRWFLRCKDARRR